MLVNHLFRTLVVACALLAFAHTVAHCCCSLFLEQMSVSRLAGAAADRVFALTVSGITGAGSVSVAVAANVVTDQAGNGEFAGSSFLPTLAGFAWSTSGSFACRSAISSSCLPACAHACLDVCLGS